MTNITCELQHSVEANVSCSFAWNRRTNIENWDDPPPNFNSSARSPVDAAYSEQVRTGFGTTLDEGMRRIAEMLVIAERSRQAGAICPDREWQSRGAVEWDTTEWIGQFGK